MLFPHLRSNSRQAEELTRGLGSAWYSTCFLVQISSGHGLYCVGLMLFHNSVEQISTT